MKIVLIGVGAIGGSVAVLAAKAGYDLDVVCQNNETAEKIKTQGFQLSGVKGEHLIKINAFSTVEELNEQYDICIISTKAYAMPDIARQMLSHIKDNSIVVSMQNGICTDILSEIVGESRTVSCMIGFGATMVSPTQVTMTSLGEFAIGMPKGQKSDKLEHLCEMLNVVVPTHISENITEELYSKLIINSCITSLGAITGETLGQMLKNKIARVLFLAIAREGMYVAKAMGLEVPPFAKVLNYNLLLLSNAKFYNILCETIFRIVGKLKYNNVKSSSLQSLERGKPTEIDYFNGYIVKKGEEFGVETPINRRMVEMIKEIERRERNITMDNLLEFKI